MRCHAWSQPACAGDKGCPLGCTFRAFRVALRRMQQSISIDSIADHVLRQLRASRAAHVPALPWSTVELYHIAPDTYPADRVAEAIAAAIQPVVDATGAFATEMVDLVLCCSSATSTLRTRLSAAEDALRAREDVDEQGLRAELNASVARCSALGDQLAELRQTHLQVCEKALLLETRFHEAAVEREQTIARMSIDLHSCQAQRDAVTRELDILRLRLRSETERAESALEDEQHRSAALRAAWTAAEDSKQRTGYAARLHRAEEQVVEGRCRLELRECECRAALLASHASESLRLGVCAPFRDVVRTCATLRRQLMAKREH